MSSASRKFCEAFPGTGVLAMRAEAFGPRGAHKIIEVTVARTDTTGPDHRDTAQRGRDIVDPHQNDNNGLGRSGVRVLSWREVR